MSSTRQVGILTDVTQCIGCQKCVSACVRTYELGANPPRRWHKSDGLTAKRWTSIIRQPNGHFVRKQCRHCVHPGCVSVCPVGAMHKSDEGPVTYDGSKCIGCRYCMMACPFGIPRYDWDQTIPYVRKCILCQPRIKEGKQPACTDACPTGATTFGFRDELIAEAQRRIQAKPDLYIPKIWGQKEVGGTSVLYISDIPLEVLTGGEALGEQELPQTTAGVMASVPFVFVGVGAAMYGLHWIIGRRMKLAQEAEAAGGPETPDADAGGTQDE
jgi:formate dehydrogenase iron-sulfur subunit